MSAVNRSIFMDDEDYLRSNRAVITASSYMIEILMEAASSEEKGVRFSSWSIFPEDINNIPLPDTGIPKVLAHSPQSRKIWGTRNLHGDNYGIVVHEDDMTLTEDTSGISTLTLEYVSSSTQMPHFWEFIAPMTATLKLQSVSMHPLNKMRVSHMMFTGGHITTPASTHYVEALLSEMMASIYKFHPQGRAAVSEIKHRAMNQWLTVAYDKFLEIEGFTKWNIADLI